MARLPNKLAGNGLITSAVNALIDCVRESVPRESMDTFMERGPLGTTRRPSRFIGGGGTTTTAYARMRIKSIQADYLTCRTWDGSTEGATDILVAKSFKLRNSITSAVIDGVTVTYAYPNTITRIATIAGTNETQVIVPRCLVNDSIMVISGFTGVVESALLDLNVDARAWAKA